MQHLFQGMLSKERLDILISLTSLRSPEVIKALEDHYVGNVAYNVSYILNGVDSSNFKRNCKLLNDVAHKVYLLNQLSV